MSSFARSWVRCLFGVVLLALVMGLPRKASAYPGPFNLNGLAGSGYITSDAVVPGGGCISCHGDFNTNPIPHNDWNIFQVSPAISVSGTGTGTTHGSNFGGGGAIFTVQPGRTANLNLTFHTATAAGAGGFLVYHNDGANDSSGVLSPVGLEHSCPDGAPTTLCGTTASSGVGNHEVMHSFPQTTANGNLAFTFQWTAPAVCSGSFGFTVWVNAVNGDSNCTLPDSSYSFTFTINISSCNDGDACNGTESCSFGTCLAGTPVTCTALDQCHSAGACNPGTGICSNPVATGAACNDGNACTSGETCSAGAVCGSPTSNVTCSALDQCHSAGTCNTGTGVCTNPVATGASCSDGNACTNGETCNAGGVCGAPTSSVTCSALDQCHDAGTCNTGTGLCTNPFHSGACSDGNSCTVGDTCNAGVCQSGPGVTCPASDQCHAPSTCSAGVCSVAAPLTGTPCNDGNACTTVDTCSAGVCNGGGPALNCNDNNVCTSDSCDPIMACQHPPAPASTVCHDGSRGVCDAVVTCGGSTVCPAFDVDHTNKQCSPPSCTGSVATPAENCNGSSVNCPTATPISCGAAVCSGNACSGGCNGDDNLCAAGNFCLANVCTPKKAVGQTCNGNNYCANGQCADGLCCNTTCGGSDPTDCQACNLAGKFGTCSINVGAQCRAGNGNCDTAEVCQAGNTACPADTAAPANTVCRASADGNVCDPAETCGGAKTCPADTATRNGTACAADANLCTLDVCANNACTHNQPSPTSVVCRNSGGACDPAENCDGVTTTCPADTLYGSAHQCRAVATGAACDVAEVCGANGVNCPGDGFLPSTQSCRGASCSVGKATPAASCTGSSGTCPAVVLDDCTPYVCQGTACGTTCNVKADCDTGFFCNPAKKCVAELPPGAACSTPESCGTGICVDGTCCNTQCTGQCQACDVPGKLGTCSPVPATDKIPHGSRPKCGGDATACHGFCDGTNTASCALPGSTTQCLAPSCSAGVATPVQVCNGSGNCPAAVPVTCAPGICQAATGPKAICVGGGGTPCTADVECAAGNYCSGGKCLTKKPDGGACGADDQCSNAHCIDGLCCDSSCDGQCEACDVAGALGKCTATTGTKPHGARPACGSDSQFPDCAGACDGKNRNACVYPGAGTSCRAASCTNDIATLPAFCTGTGLCSPAQEQACQAPNGCNAAGTICDNGCTADRDCSMGKYCSGGVCVPTLAQGDPCSNSGQCIGACVDGVCCNTTCDHQCEACNIPTKVGICTPVSGSPVLPRQACSTDGTAACAGSCNGVNRDACTFPGSTKSCSAPVCSSGVATLAGFCDGAGSCPDAQNQICAPADCAGAKCGGDCAVSGTCPAGKFCSAGVCKPKSTPGAACNDDTQCASGVCTDGVCCNVACDGQCQACDVAGAVGTCTTLVADLPHNGRAACRGFGACGATCDGTSPTKCAYASMTTSCGKSSCAVNGDELAAPLCNGVGQCLPSPAKNCGAYSCDPPSGACLTTCVLESDCAAGFSCLDAKCQQPKPDAGAADSGADAATTPDGSVATDASDDGMGPDSATDGAVADSGNAGASDGGPVLVPPEHSTDKGSCGCSVPGAQSGSSNALLLGAALTLLGIASRRRRRTAPRSERSSL